MPKGEARRGGKDTMKWGSTSSLGAFGIHVNFLCRSQPCSNGLHSYSCRHGTWLLLEGNRDRHDHLRLRRILIFRRTSWLIS